MKRTVVADTSPLNYLVLIDAINILPRMFSEVLIPPAVASELYRAKTPDRVRAFYTPGPEWLREQLPNKVTSVGKLDIGEREAILLALEVGAGLLVDDLAGRNEAAKCGLVFTGTIGILEAASSNGWINFDEYIKRLRATNFRINDEILFRTRKRLKLI